MHYLARMILGYRLGTILSYYAQITIYYQTKRLIRAVSKSTSKIVPIIANMSYLTFVMYEIIGTYYIDLFSVVFVLQVICFIFENDDFLKNKTILYFAVLSTGIATGIKLPNLLVSIFVYIFAIIKNHKDIKEIKIKDIIICAILLFTPFIIYMIDNARQIGNPFFPCLNSIFGGEYFSNYYWRDTRFGVYNPVIASIWPFYIMFKPEMANDIPTIDFIWPIGYAFVLIYIAYAIIKHKKLKEDTVFQMSCLALLLTLVWAIGLMGFTRYGIIVPILYVTVFSNFVLKTNKKYLYILWIIIALIMTSKALSQTLGHVQEMKYTAISLKKYGLFHDRKRQTIHIDGAWLVLCKESKIASLVREEGTPIYNLETMEMTNENALKRQKELKKERLYILVDNYYKDDKLLNLKAEGFEIVEVVEEDIKLDFFGPHSKIDLYRVEYKPEI